MYIARPTRAARTLARRIAMTSPLLVSAAIAACSDDTNQPSSPSSPSVLEYAGPGIPFPPNRRTLDDEYSDIAASVPGFGGLFKDPNSEQFIAYLSDSTRAPAARGALATFFAGKGLPSNTSVTFIRGRFDYRDLATWRKQIDRFDWSIVTSSDVDEANNRVVITVRDAGAQRRLTSGFSTLGIPAEAVVVEVMGETVRQATLQQTIRPMVGGVQVKAVPSADGIGECTLGFVARREFPGVGIEVNGERFITTAGHCSGTLGFNGGNVIGQPRQINRVGYLFSNPDKFGSSFDSSCPVTTPDCRRSDIALYKLDNNIDTLSTFGSYALLSGSTVIGSAAYNGKQQGFAPGQTIRMIGRSSNLKAGTVINTCINLPSAGDTLLCQFTGSYTCQGGDSGAPVWRYNAGGTWILGSHWGRRTNGECVFSNWMDAVNELAYDIQTKTGIIWFPTFTSGPANFF